MRLILALVVVAIGARAFFAGRATVLPGVEYRLCGRAVCTRPVR
jgi:hypothetical protein